MRMIRFAVDLGTTTIDTCLFDTEKKAHLAARSMKNRQSLFGSDVINRITACIKDPAHEKTMRQMVLSDLEKALTDMLKECKSSFEELGDIVICGNTAMIAILMEYDLSSMGSFPFKPPFRENIRLNAGELFSKEVPERCELFLSGCRSAFIGGDILSGISYLEQEKEFCFDREHTTLFIDLGTNGETVLNDRGKLSATSAACGPAFEGCTRRQGVYGSGTIEAIALGLSAGTISREGVLSDAFLENGIRIMGVYLDMDILRQILLAKAAIVSGIQMLLAAAKKTPEDLDRVLLAGGFGFYLNPEHAVRIGLFPKAFLDKITVVGNTSLMGACHRRENSFLSSCAGEDQIQILQLAGTPDYQETLLRNMYFEEN